MAPPHPFSTLNARETEIARDVALAEHGNEVIIFREIYLQEPSKAAAAKFLALEHAGKLTDSSPRPPRLAKVQYDVIGSDNIPSYNESIVDVERKVRVNHEIIGKDFQAPLALEEFRDLANVCKASKMFNDAIAEFELPEGFEVVIEPWPYGGLDEADENRRYFQGLIFAQDLRTKNPDSNFYAFPLPLIPIMDAQKREIVRIDRLPTGGKGDALQGKTHSTKVLEHCEPAEYVPELVTGGTRTDLKPLNVVQPDGPSFTVGDESLVEWQKWRFRVSFNPREGAVIHDVWYDGRSIMYRLSVSEMTVPYSDARSPFQRKQAFDFGDGGAGNCANNLGLGCDCLGVIKYFNAVTINSKGVANDHNNVVCLHEQDNGIGWKHTNWRTGRAVVTRNRELVVQFIITLANYEYIFAYKFDQAGAINIETRATGIVSVVNIDPGKTSEYGNVVHPGVLAQNHQHIFALRIDPAIDGHNNTVLQEESHSVPMNPETNPNGNFYEIIQQPFERAGFADAAPQHNRIFKVVNKSIKNPISGKPVGYKIMSPATQLLLADPNSIQAKRATFATHHFWVTKYRDDELFAAGRFTLQSRKETGGVADMVARDDPVDDTDVVVWTVFGLTHNPRVEDWSVMQHESYSVHLKPVDFFDRNPAIDVPSLRNLTSTLVVGNGHVKDETNGINEINAMNGTNGCCHDDVNGDTVS